MTSRLIGLATRARTLTGRQAAVVLVAVTMGAVVVIATAVGLQALAVATLGLLGTFTLLSMLQLRRRLGQGIRSTLAESRRAVTRLEAGQQRVLAALEADRLTAADHRRALETERLAAVDRDRSLRRLIGDVGQRFPARVDEARAEVVAALDRTGDRIDGLVTDVRGAVAEDRVDVLARLVRIAELGERLGEQVAGLDKSLTALTGETVETKTAALDRAHDRVVARVAAHVDLRGLIDARAPMPSLGGWAVDADILHLVATVLWEHRPGVIVECGSGSSSVWLGYLVERRGAGRVVALEHDERYLRISRDLVRAHGLEDTVEIRHAPLRPCVHDGDEYLWYAPVGWQDLTGIGLLIVDGPPRATGRWARYPAASLLFPRCGEDAVVVLDDANRPDEKALSDRWSTEWPGFERSAIADGAAHVFRRRPADRGGENAR